MITRHEDLKAFSRTHRRAEICIGDLSSQKKNKIRLTETGRRLKGRYVAQKPCHVTT